MEKVEVVMGGMVVARGEKMVETTDITGHWVAVKEEDGKTWEWQAELVRKVD